MGCKPQLVVQTSMTALKKRSDINKHDKAKGQNLTRPGATPMWRLMKSSDISERGIALTPRTCHITTTYPVRKETVDMNDPSPTFVTK